MVLPDLLATDLEWSPDGSLLAVASGRDEVTGGVLGDGRIHLYAPSSRTLRSLDPTLGARDLTWSPDGRHIAFTSGDSGGDHGLRVIDVQSEELTILTAPFGVLHGIGPVWSPTGESIAFQRGCAGCGERSSIIQFFVEDVSEAAGTGREVVVPMVRPGTAAWGPWLAPYRVTWSPDGEYLLSMAWGPVGSAILVALPTDPEEAAVVLFDPANTTHIVPYEGYDETTLVPIQTWARRPSD
jgi:Tol biopolymer transport system component